MVCFFSKCMCSFLNSLFVQPTNKVHRGIMCVNRWRYWISKEDILLDDSKRISREERCFRKGWQMRAGRDRTHAISVKPKELWGPKPWTLNPYKHCAHDGWSQILAHQMNEWTGLKRTKDDAICFLFFSSTHRGSHDAYQDTGQNRTEDKWVKTQKTQNRAKSKTQKAKRKKQKTKSKKQNFCYTVFGSHPLRNPKISC